MSARGRKFHQLNLDVVTTLSLLCGIVAAHPHFAVSGCWRDDMLLSNFWERVFLLAGLGAGRGEFFSLWTVVPGSSRGVMGTISAPSAISNLMGVAAILAVLCCRAPGAVVW